jgi:hypothetical protein
MKRSSLATVKLAAAVKRGEPEAEPKNGSLTTAIVIQKRTYDLVRAVALRRAMAGGRLSVSAVISDLIEKHRHELEREAGELTA